MSALQKAEGAKWRADPEAHAERFGESDLLEMPSPEISFPSDKQSSSSGEPASDWSLAPMTPASEGASFAPAPGRAEDRSHALEQDGFGPESFPASEPRETASEDAGGVRSPPARETKRDMARKRYKRILLLGVLPLFLSSVVAGIYVFRKVTGHASYVSEELSLFPVYASDSGMEPLGRTWIDASSAGKPYGTATEGSIRIKERPTSPPEPSSRQRISPKDALRREEVAPQSQSEPIRITRSRASDSLHAMLVTGFDAFERGDDASASAAYRNVLQEQPDNRDALLGLAAMAMRKREWEIAADYYLRILRRNPRDSVAQAALIGIRDDLDPVLGEGRIKQLLEEEPNAPYLHFSLGNLYAHQSRWRDAERAYFDAYRMSDANADYCYNLAVSLDHLAKRPAALTYYRRSLDLAGRQSPPPRFDPKVVLRRIEAIEGESEIRE
uniref:Tetratricopeptide repeat-containing protein n=1 Tax=Candidatus Kentrum sp. LPFa TaxID=2126335 RepID=A0A450W4D0_9GAMM|nr:MAG: Tetratricopeptide repeat-containing protein [Candidatus Kentron sp. LPFa]VFK28066.1 MAG: Tetratricopeptide repeat-containing protein [Candidatus Kentron sp. LPFa]